MRSCCGSVCESYNPTHTDTDSTDPQPCTDHAHERFLDTRQLPRDDELVDLDVDCWCRVLNQLNNSSGFFNVHGMGFKLQGQHGPVETRSRQCLDVLGASSLSMGFLSWVSADGYLFRHLRRRDISR